uniref:Vacuolar protein sorting 13 homolog A n=1 Tax=Salmo trutta TaxID=8032 RepID=A0A674A7F7_SALTR
MVFESVVVDVLNRFLGDYVVNLDTSQLKLGIWGGNVTLTIKCYNFQLDIPFKVRAGHIGRLELKIPWKNLYTQSVEATLDGVYLLIVPTASIKYDAEKEEKQLQEARQRELQRIEETKQKAAEQENPALEKQDTFVEKLVTQVIKNLQVKISNIHIRYEDDVSILPSVLQWYYTSTTVLELCILLLCCITLDNLFAYWNVNSTLYSNHMPDEALVSDRVIIQHRFFRPITANAKLSMNPRSDVNFSSPKVDLVVNLREVAVELNRPQYISILELLGSVDMMSRNLPYRKYRPQFHVHTNAYIWWQYVITGIMEVDVKPRLHMWSWQRIHHHRQTVKRYRALYKSKITNKKPTEKLLREVEETERTLDIFNITLARQQAEMEVRIDKAGLRIFRPGMKVEEESQGWLGWMWSGWSGDDGAKSKEVKTGAFGELMTPAEKAKLYTAIGYSEVAVNHNLPKNFEDIKIHFHMKRMSFSMKDNKDQNEILKVTVEDLKSMLTQRPGAQAIKYLSLFEVKGLANNRPAPTLLSSRKAAMVTGTPLLDILFETNPLDESADQRLHVESQPLEIIYDAVSLLEQKFAPPVAVCLDELTNATLMKLEQFRDRTSTGLMYVIETQKVLDLNVNLMASYVIVPQTGFYDSTQNLMLLDLGHFKVSSLSRKGLPQLSVGSRTIQDIMSQAYDSFNIKLSSLQFLYSKPDGDWRKARKMKQSALHILEPVDVKVVFSRAMVVTDSRMPKFKIFGEMPLLSLRISDDKVRAVLELINSIPLPESRPAPRSTNTHSTPKVLTTGSLSACLWVDFVGLSLEKKVHLITTLDNTEEDLLTLEYTKADKNGPEFKSQYKNTEQSVTVNFSSLDVHLHTEALLNAMNFLNSLLPPTKEAVPSKEELPTIPEEDEGEGEGEEASKKSKFEDVVNLHIRADLNCLKVFIRGQSHMIAEIRIEGNTSHRPQHKSPSATQVTVRNTSHRPQHKSPSCVSIADKEVFAFRMVNHTDATEGDAYLDMGKVDTSISLTVGCIQVIFLNKFVSSILAFINNFQAAKEALAEVTVQAAEKAATGVMELAERSTRISLNVDFKAPLVFLPQSSSSTNVTVADLGMVTVKNCFALVDSQTHVKIPPIIDTMTVGLSDLKMYRTTFEKGRFQGEIQVLKPVNLDLSIQRNLSASWYHSIPDIKITAHLKPMNLILSQDDMTVVLRTLGENMSETSDAASPRPPLSTVDRSDTATTKGSQGTGGTVVTAAVVETQKSTKLKNTLKVDFKFDSMTLVLYSPNGTEVQVLDSRDDQLMLAEFTLGTISTSVHMFSDGSMKASVKLTDCLLDDKRRRVKNITRNVMVEVNYNQGREGTSLEMVVQDVYLCASMEFLLTVADIFLKASQQAPVAVKSVMNVLVKNPEIVFVADLTRADAPALVMTMECELVMKSNLDGQLMTAVVKDLKVVACPFLREKRRNKETTVLQPCQVFFKSTQSSTSPQAMEVSIKALTLKVSPIIINTVITIQSVLSPAGADMPQSELESPVPPDLWERRSWQDLKLWFLEEEGKDEDAQSLVRLIPQGESLQVAISSICLTLEAGVGHRTVPMLLAKSSFHGDVKNWSTLINLHSQLNLEVHYFNEVMGVWEPLLEPLEDEIRDSFRSWTLGLKMKKKPVKYSGISDEVDCSIPDYKTIISISSKDQLNITLSKCGLGMLSNLGTAFAEAAKQTSESFQEDEAPFVVKNHLGLTVSVVYSEMFCPLGREATENRVELQNGESVNMDYRRTTTHSDQFSAMTSLVAKDYYIQPTPVGHTSASVIPLIKVGRGMYSVMHKVSGVTRFLVCQIYSVQGSKHIKIRSPFQIINHFSIPFRVMEGSTCLGISLPTEEFCVPLDSYRSKLSLQPITEGDNQYDSSEGFSYESVSQQPGARVQQTCHRHGNSASVLMVNIVPLKDTVTSQHTGVAGEHFDEPYILHLWPSVLLRNLLPYPITYRLQRNGPTVCYNSELHTAVMDLSSLELHLLNYLGQDWKAHYGLRGDQDEITFIELDIAVHVKYDAGLSEVAIHSPYWMVNKTGRLLQYKANDIHRKHAMDYDMPLLFSFKPRNFLHNNKVRLMISDSELSDDFSLDTVGSYGEVKCKGRLKDYLIGVKIDPSSFSLTRIVSFVPYYLLVNRTKHVIWVGEEGQDHWTKARPHQVPQLELPTTPNAMQFNPFRKCNEKY